MNSLMWTATRKALRVLGAGFGLLVFTLPLFSQANQGAIQGGVFDQTGGAIAGATVTVIDLARGVARPLTTDSAGVYLAPVGQSFKVDLVLQPGAQTQTQTITVTSAAPSGTGGCL